MTAKPESTCHFTASRPLNADKLLAGFHSSSVRIARFNVAETAIINCSLRVMFTLQKWKNRL